MNSFGNGGGFMANNSPGMGSQGSPRTGNKNKTNKSFTSLTIAQIQRAEKMMETENAEYWLDGRELASINIVGVIREKREDSTKSTFKIDDGTGFIEVTLWHDNTDNEAKNRDHLSNEKSVRVFGRLSGFGNNNIRRITAFKIVPVVDSNIITYHMLECMTHHVAAKKGTTASVVGHGSLGASSASMPLHSAYRPQESAPSGAHPDLNSEQNSVLAVIAATTADEGAAIMEVVASLAGSISEAKTREIIDWLNEEGHIYSTIDEDHYRSVQE